MDPVDFPQSNKVFMPPKGMDNCEPLHTHVIPPGEPAGPAIISCWKVTPEELEEIKRTGLVYLWVVGTGIPPMSVHGKSPWG